MENLGKRGKDKVTNFEGIITAKISYLTGCDQYGITPEAKDSKIESNQWFDTARVEIVGEGVSVAQVTGEVKGGDNRDCPK